MNETEFLAPTGLPELLIRHVFDAPVEQVFTTWITPETLPLWWGPAYLETTVEHMRPVTGGSYRIFQRAPDGSVHGFHGVYHAVDAPHRIVSTFEYEGAPGHVTLDTLTFTERDGRTHYTSHSIFQSLADRDAMLSANCEPGVRETMARMAELLRRMEAW